MKKTMKLLGIIALVAIIGFGVTGCSKKESGGGSARVGKAAPATDFSYELTSDGQGIKIKKYKGNGGIVNIPEKIEGYPVTVLATTAFTGNAAPGSLITSVIIPASVKKIESFCFQNANNLTSVTFLGRGVELAIGVFPPNLSELNMPDGDKVLFPLLLGDGEEGYGDGLYAFLGCQKLPLAVRSKLQSWGFTQF